MTKNRKEIIPGIEEELQAERERERETSQIIATEEMELGAFMTSI